MKGDFSRVSHQPEKHYSRVLMQQGRVQLDADWNEQADILVERRRTAVKAIVGPAGGPVGVDSDGKPVAGFEIVSENGALVARPGIYFVDGILCHLDQDKIVVPDSDNREPGIYIAYLEVWERHVTALDDPALREVALGGPDTTTRLEVVQRVRLVRVANRGNQVTCADFSPPDSPSGALTASTVPPPAVADDCIIPPDAGYQGMENQLYRVEVHGSGPAGRAMFKWSRDNGTVVARWVGQSGAGGRLLEIEPWGRDDRLCFRPGDWVELTSEEKERDGKPGHLVQLEDVVDNVVTVAVDDSGSLDIKRDQIGANPKIRRWDGPLRPIEADAAMPLEQGVVVTFSSGEYRGGDYWLIAARAALVQDGGRPPGGLLWPTDDQGAPLAQAPAGVRRHYAPLAICDWENAGNKWGAIQDCRQLFPSLTALPDADTGTVTEPVEQRKTGCCRVTVGDGILSHGDFKDIQSAVDRVENGGTVCLLPGQFQLRETVVVQGGGITIQGCGAETVITAADSAPAFSLAGSKLTLRNVTIKGETDLGLIRVQSSDNISISNCVLNTRRWGIQVIDSDDIVLHNNECTASHAFGVQGSRVVIERNTLLSGGIQIWEGSKQIHIERNIIKEGESAGIQLGGSPPDIDATLKEIRQLVITGNEISGMKGAGIRTAVKQEVEGQHKEGESNEGEITDVLIHNNQLTGNAVRQVDFTPNRAGIFLEDVTKLKIDNNRIMGNATNGGYGIHLANVLDVTLHDNHVAGNGKIGELVSGQFQAAVIIREVQGIPDAVGIDRSPALSISRNRFETAIGPALVVTGGGRVNIEENYFQSGKMLADNSESGEKYGGHDYENLDGLILSGNHISIENFVDPDNDGANNRALAETRFCGNRSYCLEQSGRSRDIPIVAIISPNSDLSFEDNQFSTVSIVGTIHALACGRTVRAVGNRLWSQKIFAGYISAAFIATAAVIGSNNQSSHQLFIDTDPSSAGQDPDLNKIVNSNNQILS